ncbi:MAG: matrixin family metalloprotease [Minisyncoccia bacterium]
MRLIKGILKTFVLLGVLWASAFYLYPRLPFWSVSPCSEPIPYTLDNFSKDFNITEKYFLDALLRAEAVWEKPAGKNLFIYSPEDSSRDALKINLVYDYRQQATEKLADLGIVVNNNQSSYDSLRARFEKEKNVYEQEKLVFSARVEAFNKRSSTYEEQVKFWNQKGGAPEAEFNKLEKERLALDREAQALKLAQSRLNNMADEVNALVVAINRLAGTLNLTVEKFNDINIARGESFEEGVYVEEGGDKRIDIYEFSTEEKLVRVLAHELGHALGIDHVPDSKAIMYEFNEENSLTLTDADKSALANVCKSGE